MIKPLWKQVYTSVGVNLLTCGWMFVLTLQSIIIPTLRQADSGIVLTQEQESWLAAIAILMLLPSQTICGYLIERYGRKYLLCFGCLPLLAANIIISCAGDYMTLLIGLLLTGIAGGPLGLGSLYTAEYTSPRYRGAIVSARAPAQSISIMVCHFLGMLCHWKTLALVGLIPGVVGIIIVFTSAESPPWLASKGRFEECEKAHKFYRGDDENDELDQLIGMQRKILAQSEEKEIKKATFRSVLRFLFDLSFLKACAICLACTIFIDCSGKQIFNMLALDIITKIMGSSSDVFYYALGMDIFDLIATMLSCYFVKKFKRRTLLFKMAIPAIILLLLFCLLSFLTSKGIMPQSLSWITLAVIVSYFFILSGFVTPVAYTFFVEVIPLSHRGLGMAVNGFMFYIFLFVFTKMTPSLLREYEAHGTFMINAVLISVALLGLYYMSPETGDKTLIDIELEMKGKQEEANHPDEVEQIRVK